MPYSEGIRLFARGVQALDLGSQPMSMLPPSRGGHPSLGWGGVTAIFFLAALSFRCEEECFFFILDTLPAPIGCSWLLQ